MAQIILDSNNNLIQGDFDNATLNNRTKLQTTTTNATTNVYIAPNGSSTSAGVSVANNSSLTNASKIVMATNGTTDTQIISGVNGSGTYLPMSFYTNNTLAMQITTAGNILVASTAAPAFSACSTANQTISNETSTKILFDTENFDTNNNFASSRFTPTVAGYYQISGATRVVANSTGEFFIGIGKNGSVIYRGMNSNFASTIALVGLTVSGLVYLNGSTDYVEMFVYQGTGSSKAITGDIAITWMTGFLARSA
jgi:hypothetical protein